MKKHFLSECFTITGNGIQIGDLDDWFSLHVDKKETNNLQTILVNNENDTFYLLIKLLYFTIFKSFYKDDTLFLDEYYQKNYNKLYTYSSSTTIQRFLLNDHLKETVVISPISYNKKTAEIGVSVYFLLENKNLTLSTNPYNITNIFVYEYELMSSYVKDIEVCIYYNNKKVLHIAYYSNVITIF